MHLNPELQKCCLHRCKVFYFLQFFVQWIIAPLRYKDRSTLLQNKPEAQRLVPWRIDEVEWQGGANFRAAEISRANRKSKGQGVTVLGWCLSTAPRVIAGHCWMVPDSRWPCRTHWKSCEISPAQQRSKVKFSFSVFFFPACSAPCCNFDEDFICSRDSVIFCSILIQALLLICAEVIWLVSSTCNRRQCVSLLVFCL